VAEESTGATDGEGRSGADAETLLRLIDALPDYAVFSLDPAGAVTTWNSGAERILGYTEAEIIGQSFEAFFTPEDIDAGAPRAELEHASGQGSVQDEGWRLRKDGSPLWAHVVTSAIKDERGKMQGFLKVMRDVTDVHRAEQALRASEALKTAVLDSSLDCMVAIDGEGRIIEFNPAAEQCFGYTRLEVLGHVMADLIVPPDLRDRHRAALKRVVTTGEGTLLDRRLEMRGMRADGTEFPAEVTITRVSGGSRPVFAGYVRDITDRDRHQQELSQRTRQVARLAEERGRLVAQALEAEDRERRRISQALHDDALQTLLSVDQDVADVMKGSASQDVLTRVREGLASAIRQLRDTALELHPLLLERKGLETALDTIAQGAAAVGGFRCTVRVEPDAIGVNDQFVLSIVRELLMNASKHAGASRVSVVVERNGTQMEIEVADDGAGLPPGRVEAALAEGHIGLAILTERLDAIGGRFEIVTRDAGGTTARAIFPVEAGIELRSESV
jgi:two-component system, LuxR family, sensor kinase FixL